MRAGLRDISIREEGLWFRLLTYIAVAIYYFPQEARLTKLGDEALSGEAMSQLIVNTVYLAVAIGVVLSWLFHKQQKQEPMDERDRQIQARGQVLYSVVMASGVLWVMGMIVLQELHLGPGENLALTPLAIAHMLLRVLMAASIASLSLRLYLYRRGN